MKQFWNSTFGKAASLRYSDELREALEPWHASGDLRLPSYARDASPHADAGSSELPPTHTKHQNNNNNNNGDDVNRILDATRVQQQPSTRFHHRATELAANRKRNLTDVQSNNTSTGMRPPAITSDSKTTRNDSFTPIAKKPNKRSVPPPQRLHSQKVTGFVDSQYMHHSPPSAAAGAIVESSLDATQLVEATQLIEADVPQDTTQLQDNDVIGDNENDDDDDVNSLLGTLINDNQQPLRTSSSNAHRNTVTPPASTSLKRSLTTNSKPIPQEHDVHSHQQQSLTATDARVKRQRLAESSNHLVSSTQPFNDRIATLHADLQDAAHLSLVEWASLVDQLTQLSALAAEKLKKTLTGK